jgi:hypothetical protein
MIVNANPIVLLSEVLNTLHFVHEVLSAVSQKTGGNNINALRYVTQALLSV